MSDTEAIRPYVEGEYQGPPATPDNFAHAFPEIADAAARPAVPVVPGVTTPLRGRRPLDSESQKNLDELYLQVRANPFKPATVINMHPWRLMFPMSEPYVRGIVIRACPPGDMFSYEHIRAWSPEKKQLPGDKISYGFTAIRPIQKACEFLREFANPDIYGGGIIVYEGDGHPDKVKRVELYNPDGRPQVTSKQTMEEDNEGHQIPVLATTPIYGNLEEMILQERRRVDEFYMKSVTWADAKWKEGTEQARKLVTDRYRDMAEVLWRRGIIPEMPGWNIMTTLQQGLSEHNCKSCGSVLTAKAYKCSKCSNIIDPLAAYLDFAIEFTHAKMAMLNDEQMEMAETEKARREKMAADARAARAAKKAAETKK